MNRKERRIQKRPLRRIGVVLASMMALGATAGLGGTAFARNGYGGDGGGINYNYGQDQIFCNGFWAQYPATHLPGHGSCGQGPG